jgi:hypothetical protein
MSSDEVTPRVLTIVVTGNPVDGFAMHGPFHDTEQATEWAESSLRGDWWLADLTAVGPPGRCALCGHDISDYYAPGQQLCSLCDPVTDDQ